MKRLLSFLENDGEFILVMLLAFLSSVVVFWQTGRVLPLLDYSYQIENAYRIAVGQVPYRDFILITTPFMHYLLAIFMKLLGFSSNAPLAYMLIVSFLTVIFTYWILILLNISKKVRVFLLVPLVIAAHGIVPLPSYDVTTTLFVLLSIILILRLLSKSKSGFLTGFIAGVLIILPALTKQNVGVAYILTVYLSLSLINHVSPQTIDKKTLFNLIAGSMTVIILFCSFLAISGAMLPFIRQNMFVLTNRDPLNYGRKILQDIFYWKNMLIYIPLFIAFMVIRSSRNRKLKTMTVIISILLSFVAIPTMYLCFISRQSIYADLYLKLRVGVRYFFSVWYAVLFISFALFMRKIRMVKDLKRNEMVFLLIEMVLGCTIMAALFAQGVGGSTFGIYPFFILLLAVFHQQLSATYKQISWDVIFKVILGATTAFLAVFGYLNIRQSYVPVVGQPRHFVSENLRHLGTPGPWTQDIDTMLQYVKSAIPHTQSVVAWPGEDPFYFATRRKPMLRYFELFSGALPYTSARCIKDIIDNDIEWLIIKTRTQSSYYMDTKPIIKGLSYCYNLYKLLPGYSIYKRSHPCKEMDSSNAVHFMISKFIPLRVHR